MQGAWFETIFDERYPELFGPLEGNAEREVEEVLGLIALPGGSAVEDLGCGRGRHAIPLARRGFAVTGVDLSDKMLGIARAQARREGVSVEWIREDMRVFRRPSSFDLCLSLFTSFGFFNDEENQKVLENISVSLKKGGTLLLDLRNAGKGLSRLESWDQTIDVPSGKLRMSIRFNVRTMRAKAKHVLTRKDGIRISSTFDVRVYSIDELEVMIRNAGMHVRNCFGSFSGEPFTDKSGRMVVLSTKH